MRAIATRKTTAIIAVALVAAGLTSSTAVAATQSFDLCAVVGTAQVTATTSVPVWGFAVPTTPGDCTTATADIPGPTLSVAVGDAVTINVINALGAPAGAHTIQIEIPGVDIDATTSTPSADPGGTATVTFTATNPGTYLYQSAGGSGRQVAMGLSGALIVRPTTPNQAYGPSTTYTDESILVLSAVDPSFNASPDAFDLLDYQAQYWLINGEAYPDADPIVAPAGSTLLIRYLNAGYDNTSMSLLGLHERVVARDAIELTNPFLADADTIPAGATEDAIVTIPSPAGPPTASGFPLFNRNLHLTNGSTGTLGGMLTFIVP